MTNRFLATIVLAGAFVLLLLGMIAGGRESVPVCHALLLPAECRQIQGRYRQATSAGERQAVEAAYRELIAERERLCPHVHEPDDTTLMQPVQLPDITTTARTLAL
ncbi:MAG TPA: hypothetical protein PLW81_10665 [Thiobacillaceae bacterium]|nr:hypothetical protein [Thiobacillaceae bacterium]